MTTKGQSTKVKFVDGYSHPKDSQSFVEQEIIETNEPSKVKPSTIESFQFCSGTKNLNNNVQARFIENTGVSTFLS